MIIDICSADDVEGHSWVMGVVMDIEACSIVVHMPFCGSSPWRLILFPAYSSPSLRIDPISPVVEMRGHWGMSYMRGEVVRPGTAPINRGECFNEGRGNEGNNQRGWGQGRNWPDSNLRGPRRILNRWRQRRSRSVCAECVLLPESWWGRVWRLYRSEVTCLHTLRGHAFGEGTCGRPDKGW